MTESQELKRELGIFSAVLLGLGSILGTGVFVSTGIVAGVVGSWILPVIVCAAFLAFCNAMSSAQLAAAYPRSGGTYEYGYRVLTPYLGFTAGWMFLLAKSASAATAALGFAFYLSIQFQIEGEWQGISIALLAVIVLTFLVAGGLKRSNAVNTVIVILTVCSLFAFTIACSLSSDSNWSETLFLDDKPSMSAWFQGIALMFVAYTGYGRVATLGEEVKNPRQTIPIAILSTLGISLILYLIVSGSAVDVVGAEKFYEFAQSYSAPLEAISILIDQPELAKFVTLGAMAAMLGVLLNLLLGLSRVLFAMGRRGDMPSIVGKVHEGKATPRTAVLVIGAFIFCLTLYGKLEIAWSFSAFTVLIYYALTNLACLRLAKEQRLYPRIFSVLGLIGCSFLAFWVEPIIWGVGLGMIALGTIWFLVAQKRKRESGTPGVHP